MKALVLTTDTARPEERLEYWNAVLCDMMFGFSIVADTPRQFEGRLVASQLDMLLVCDSSGKGRMATRDKRWIAQAPEHVYALLVDFAAAWVFYWQGVPQRMEPGDMVLIDTRFEQRALSPDNCMMRNIRLPQAWLESWIADPAQIAGRRISRSAGWGAALSASVAQLSPGWIAAPPVPGSVLTDHLGSLLSLVYAEMSSRPVAPHGSDAAVVARMRDVLGQRSAEAGLSAREVAGELQLGAAVLHRILASAGLLFSSELLMSRLTAARRMLESPAFDALTTAEIGRRAGFTDASHFARVAGKHFGSTPGQLRRRRE